MSDLFLVSVEVSARRLVEDARRRGQAMREIDPGYLIHGLLEGVFGPKGLRPFQVDHSDDAKVRLLGYAARDASTLASDAQAFATPEAWAAIDWSSLQTKRMPDAWSPGRRLGFTARVCPVVRLAGPPASHRTRDGEGAAGREQDAWLVACRRDPGASPPPDRADVYRGWLAEALKRSGGANLIDAEMTAFQVATLHRRTQGVERRPRRVRLPDATFSGTLEVADPEAFAVLLARGIGRHRAFGFGMLLVRPPRC